MNTPPSLGASLKRLFLQEPDLSLLHRGEIHYPAERLDVFFTDDLPRIAAEAELDLHMDLVRFHRDGVTVRGTVSFPARLALGNVKSTLVSSAPWAWDLIHDATVCAGFDFTFQLEWVDLSVPPGKLYGSIRFDDLGVQRVGDFSLGLLGKLPLLKNYLGTEALQDAGFRWLATHIDHDLVGEGPGRVFYLGTVPTLGETLERRVDVMGRMMRWPDVFANIRATHSHQGITVRVDLNQAMVNDLAHRFINVQLFPEQTTPKQPARKRAPAKPKAKKPAAKKTTPKTKTSSAKAAPRKKTKGKGGL